MSNMYVILDAYQSGDLHRANHLVILFNSRNGTHRILLTTPANPAQPTIRHRAGSTPG